MTPADTCRANGWTVGTRLVGDEGYGPSVIEITAVGEELVLAKTISHAGKRARGVSGWETTWMLDLREWAVMAECVCDHPADFCGGADTDTTEEHYCRACDDLDPEEHCLRCPFECCS